ncbi:MAG: hypothetical protein ABIF19_13535 [Planctomycetota bacterium]
MTKLSFKPILKVVLLSAVSVSFLGCSGSLDQQTQTVRVSPVSDEYRLTERLQGKTYILLAETSTGQEQHRYAVSDSLARVLKENDESSKDEKAKHGIVNLSFLGFNGISKIEDVPNEGLEVFSFTDLTNKLNEKDQCQRHAEMKEFYQENGMFRKSDLDFLTKEIGADYIVLPCLLEVQRWSKGRLSVGGVRFLQTHVVSGMLGLEIWNTRTGRKVFSATSDVTIASERIKEAPMSMEEAFDIAWFGIVKELPGYSPAASPVPVDNEQPDRISPDKHADSPILTDDGEQEIAMLELSS